MHAAGQAVARAHGGTHAGRVRKRAQHGQAPAQRHVHRLAHCHGVRQAVDASARHPKVLEHRLERGGTQFARIAREIAERGGEGPDRVGLLEEAAELGTVRVAAVARLARAEVPAQSGPTDAGGAGCAPTR